MRRIPGWGGGRVGLPESRRGDAMSCRANCNAVYLRMGRRPWGDYTVVATTGLNKRGSPPRQGRRNHPKSIWETRGNALIRRPCRGGWTGLPMVRWLSPPANFIVASGPSAQETTQSEQHCGQSACWKPFAHMIRRPRARLGEGRIIPNRVFWNDWVKLWQSLPKYEKRQRHSLS